MEESNNIFEEYLKEKRRFIEIVKQPKFWIFFLVAIFGIFLILKLYFISKSSFSAEELRKTIQVVWHDSAWVNKEVTPYEVKIVPSIIFKIKNIGARPVKDVKFVGVFVFEETGDQIGDGVTPLLRKTLNPGETSEGIIIKSLYGYSASSKEAFLENKQEWKKIKVRLLARTAEGFAQLGTYSIKQEIEGVEGKYKLDDEKVDAEKSKMTEELGKSIQIIRHETYWTDKQVTASEAIIVPQIVMTVKNIGGSPLHHVIFKGTFIFEDNEEQLSQGLCQALEEPLGRDKISEEIVIKAEYGYSASSKASFIRNIQDWRQVKVRVYAKIQPTGYALLGTFPVERKIEGVRVLNKPVGVADEAENSDK